MRAQITKRRIQLFSSTKVKRNHAMTHQLKNALLSLLTIVAFCLMSGAYAQEITGSIVGTVKDSSGASVKGATVSITDNAKQVVVRTVQTGDDGQFSIPDLTSAFYDITV